MNIIFNFEGKCDISMRTSELAFGGIDFEFSINGDVLPIVKIGKRGHYTDSYDLVRDVYVPVAEASYDNGILDVEDDKFSFLCVDKKSL